MIRCHTAPSLSASATIQVVRILVATLLTVLGWSMPAPAVAAPDVPTLANSYDYSHYDEPTEYIAPERGQPSATVTTSERAVGHWSDGASAAPQDRATTHTRTVYDSHAVLAQNDKARSTTSGVVGAIDGDIRKLPAGLVATNTGSRLAEASSSAFRAADNVGDFTVSAKHLPGAGGRWNKWAEGVDINGTIASALRSDGATFLPNPVGAADSFIVRTNVGSIIGTKGQTFVKAVISSDGRIITAYPVK